MSSLMCSSPQLGFLAAIPRIRRLITTGSGGDYVDLLETHQIGISMSRKGNPWDNPARESFMQRLKYEEVFRRHYRHLHEVSRSPTSWRKPTTPNGFTQRSAICGPQSSNSTSHHKNRSALRAF